MLGLRTLLSSIAIMIGITQSSTARPHYNAWFRTTLSVPASSKFKVDIELQHRRQSRFTNDDPLDKNLMFSARSWIHYQPSKNLKFSVSPFAYFSNYKIIQKQQDESIKPNSEIRFSAAAGMLENSTNITRLKKLVRLLLS